MNRIKTRAWDVTNQKMVYQGFSVDCETGLAVVIDYNLENNTPHIKVDIKSPEEWIVMISSGIEDKTGGLIYHNDILYTPATDLYCVVKFGDTFEIMEEGYYGWYCENLNVDKVEHKYSQLNQSMDISSYVVGNIYTTPNFL